MQTIAWIVTTLCLAGTALNVKKNVACFYLWAVGNIMWLAIDICLGLTSRALLDLVQLIFAVWGIYEWRNKSESKAEVQSH